MSRLKVVFRLGLAHPLLVMDSLNTNARAHFPDTGNTVWIEVQLAGSWSDNAIDRGVFDLLLLHVERECEPGDRDSVRMYGKLEEWSIISDAATTLGRFLEYIRDEDFLRSGTVAGYPAVTSESPQANPIVQVAKAEIIFDGQTLTTLSLSGVLLCHFRRPSSRHRYGMRSMGNGTPTFFVFNWKDEPKSRKPSRT
jgi:hypothetical protein